MPRDSVTSAKSSTKGRNSKKRPVESDEEEEEVEEVVEVPASEEPGSGGEQNGDGDEEEEEEEFEIEAIIKATRGIFPDKPSGLAYFVKWKGFGSSDNSWVTEEDAAGAKELIDAFWAKKKKEKPKGSASARPKVSKAAPRRQSTAESEEDEEDEVIASISAPAPKKRGRQPRVSKDEEDAMEVDDEEEIKPKRSRKDQTATAPLPAKTKAKANKKKVQEEEEEDELSSTEPGVKIGDMSAYKNHKNWEEIIHRIDTVERQSDGDLVVYLTLKKSMEPRHAKVTSDVAKQKFPQRMLDFYEANLKWRPVPDSE